jgi:hypothetical protein
MPGMERLPPKSQKSLASQASTVAVSPFAQAPPGSRVGQTGRLFDQFAVKAGAPFIQRNDWLDSVTNNSDDLEHSLGYSFSPTNSTNVEHHTSA